MANYEIEPSVLEPLVPRGTELDFYADRTFVSLVGFLMLRTRVAGIAAPWHRNFEEVNLRFYVRRTVAGEVRRGVAFVREIVPRWAIAATARRAYNEPYIALPMRHEVSGVALAEGQPQGTDPRVSYAWRSSGQWLGVSLACVGEALPLIAGSHEQFIAEHYWGYCSQQDGGTIEYQVEHPAWNYWPSATATCCGDIANFYGPRFAAALTREPASTFVADGSPVLVHRPTRIA
jgi:uncharacterized protein YqjF (DUF2071 family)